MHLESGVVGSGPVKMVNCVVQRSEVNESKKPLKYFGCLTDIMPVGIVMIDKRRQTFKSYHRLHEIHYQK